MENNEARGGGAPDGFGHRPRGVPPGPPSTHIPRLGRQAVDCQKEKAALLSPTITQLTTVQQFRSSTAMKEKELDFRIDIAI